MEKSIISNSYRLSAWILYATVSLLFIVKYISRIGVSATVLGCLLYILGITLIYAVSIRRDRFTLPLLITYTIIAGVFVPIFFPPGKFELDRWDMITVFSDALFSGEYPYAAEGVTSGNTPAQSPFYFLLCLPFHAAKWYVGIPIVGVWIYYLATKKGYLYNSSSTLLIIFSPFVVYETLTCSTIFFNSALVMAWMLWIQYTRRRDNFFMVMHALAGGLLLCTRNCFIIPIVLLGVMMLIHNKRKATVLLWGAIIILVFSLLYLPFVFGWSYLQWETVNPFKVQSEVILSMGMMTLIVGGTIVTGFFCKNYNQVIFCSGIWLFAACVIMLIETSLRFGFKLAFFESYADITYFILSIPFIMPFIDCKKKTLR